MSATVVNGAPVHVPDQHGAQSAPDGEYDATTVTVNGATGVPAQRPQPPANGAEPLPGVAAAGAAAGAVAREAAAQQAPSPTHHAAPAPGLAAARVGQQPPTTGVPAQRAHAAPPAVSFPPNGRRQSPDHDLDQGVADGAARQEPPHVEFQAPPPMPPLPRRSVRESELLTAARQVERWRGQPSATRISRELGIGTQLATFLANALREEDGLAPDES